jgi:hypothetical protein
LSGSIDEIASSDDLRIHARSQFGFTASEPNILEMRLGAVTDDLAATEIDLTVEGRVNQPGGACRLRLRNWANNFFNDVHQYPIGTTEAVEQVIGIAATNYIRQTDGRIELAIRQSMLTTFTVQGFDSFTDWVEVVTR